ncbi:MAG: radical SAM protein [Archangiaceae bacterium]|nr:radical SAM protein [Archangiaceae bacterium]
MLRRVEVGAPHHPHYVVWELTLACDQRCLHCGSRAEHARPNELTTEQALDVVEQLARMGAWEVTLIGGEAYLHPGFLDVVRALRRHGVRPTLTTGGRGVTPELAAQLVEAGLHSASVSIDGLESTHDLFRATRGSFQSALSALANLRSVGITTAVNTNFNRLNVSQVDALYELVKANGASSWMLILTVPLGRGADRPDMLLQPWDLLELMPAFARAKERGLSDGIMVMPSNTVGYFGPEETLLRSQERGQGVHFQGCVAGRYSLGIEADGAVKGCPSLQTSHYVGGSLKTDSLEAIWKTKPLAFARTRTVDDLWGFCRTCPFAKQCLGGCTFMSHAYLGRPGNNPMCHFRARSLAADGRRERLVFKEAAPGAPFDNGLFEIVEEAFDAPDPRPPTPGALVRKR